VTAACGRKRDSARRRLVALAAAAGCALVVGLAAPGVASAASAGGATASARAAAAAGGATWRPARQAVNPEHFDITVDGISCTAPGDCTAAGAYQQVIDYKYVFEGFVMDQRGGVWGPVAPIPGLLALNTGGYVTIAALSCASPGNCLVGGSYDDTHNNEYAFTVGERGGKWGRAQEVPGTAMAGAGGYVTAAVTSVSCASPGNCVAGGSDDETADNGHAFIVGERAWKWGRAEQAPGTAALNSAAVTSVACPAAGDCTLLGRYGASDEEATFAAGEKNGVWRSAAPLPGTATAYALSCVSPGNCVAGGDYRGGSMTVAQAAVWRETGGTWSAARLLPSVAALNDTAAAPGSAVTLLSCTSLTFCAAGGYSTDRAPDTVPYVIDETGGTWGTARRVPGLASLGVSPDGPTAVTSLSCGSRGDCTLGGYYFSGFDESWDDFGGFLAAQTGGSWGKAHRVPGLPAPGANKPITNQVTAVSCTADGFCGAAGTDSDTYYQTIVGAFVVNKEIAK
jgi:hypothetical protein